MCLGLGDDTTGLVESILGELLAEILEDFLISDTATGVLSGRGEQCPAMEY